MARILAVDDAELILGQLHDRLSEAGHEVIRCTSARRALEIVDRGDIELIITDVYMPEMDGLELLGHLRRRRTAPPVIVMSGAPQPQLDVLAVGVKLGAAAMLQKPFTSRQLLETVDSVLARTPGHEFAARRS